MEGHLGASDDMFTSTFLNKKR